MCYAYVITIGKWIEMMQQVSSLITVFMVVSIFSARFVSAEANEGNWIMAIGTFLIAPLLFFFVFHTVLYLVVRMMRGREGVASYTNTKINCLSALVTILATMAAV